jgi:hypothetical protein
MAVSESFEKAIALRLIGRLLLGGDSERPIM